MIATKQEPSTNGRPSRFSEIGASGLRAFSGIIDEEFLQQLRGQQRLIRAMREMSENDDIAGAVLYAIEMLLRGVTRTVEPGGDTASDLQAAELLETCLDDMSHTWADFVSEWMAAPVFGFAPFEIVWKQRTGDVADPAKRSRYTDGQIGVRKLAIRHPDTLVRWMLDETGGVQGMEQSAPPNYKLVRIPIERMLLFRIRSRKGNPEGMPLLRNAWPSYYRKKRIGDIEAIGIERNLAGLPVLYVPPQWMNPSAAPEDQALFEVAKRIVRDIRVDEQAGVVLPMHFDPDTNQPLIKLELLSSGGGGTPAVNTSPVIERLDRRIAMTILADVILLGHEKVGSFALASSKTNLFAAGMGALKDSIQDTINRHLVPRLLRLNGYRLPNPPELRLGDIETVDIVELGNYITQLANAGAPLFPDEELESYLRSAANLPQRTEPLPALPPLPGESDDPFAAEPDEAPDVQAA